MTIQHFQILETHISWVLLTGPYAYKIKKPVNLGFLNFSTLDRRRFFCEEELRLNQRLAPDFYLNLLSPLLARPNLQICSGTGEPDRVRRENETVSSGSSPFRTYSEEPDFCTPILMN